MKKSIFVKETLSTNELMREMLRNEKLPEGFVVQTDFQTAGKGQIGNLWEAENGKNLLFSIVLYPNQVPMDQLFILSQLVSLAIVNELKKFADGFTVKWPNDIYWNDKKLAGILIENAMQGKTVKTIIGIGLNVNQQVFVSDAPNPVSLFQITGKPIDRERLLTDICQNINSLYSEMDIKKIRTEYAELLYRKNGFFMFKAENEVFSAKITAIHPDGKLELETENDERREFYFKELEFV